MKTDTHSRRERTIAFDMNYCQHYQNRKGADMVCTAGVDMKTLVKVATGTKQIRWGPCIDGHTLADPKAHCPYWVRRTREHAEQRADKVELSIAKMEQVDAVVGVWRKKPPIGKQEIIECPVCKGRLHLSQSSYNGHVRGQCETKECVNWNE